MLMFAVAHAVQLRDGTYAVRSPDFPGCEARNTHVELAREQFGDILQERLLEMIAAGKAPALYTYEELAESFPARCALQISVPDRMPATFDRVMAVRAKLSPEAAERLDHVRAAPQSEPDGGNRKAVPGGAAVPVPQNTSAPEGERRGRLDPSARLAVAAARLARRDGHAG
jgi:hypothetical protein